MDTGDGGLKMDSVGIEYRGTEYGDRDIVCWGGLDMAFIA
jgi:hypothetical protein